MPRVRRQRNGREKRDQKTDLRPLVQLATAREVRGDLSLRKGMEEGRRISVVPDQDREIAEAPLTTNRLTRDEIRDALGFLDAGHSLNMVDVDFVVGLPTVQSLVDAEGRLETFGVLRDEPIGGVQQTL